MVIVGVLADAGWVLVEGCLQTLIGTCGEKGDKDSILSFPLFFSRRLEVTLVPEASALLVGSRGFMLVCGWS